VRLPAAIVAQTRAVLIVAAATVALIGSAPMPGPSSRDALESADARAEMRAWSELLGGLGVPVLPESLGEAAFRIGQAARATRAAVLDPLKPLIRLTGTAQGWGLFAYPKVNPHSLRIEVRRGAADWEPVYDSLDPELRWSASWLHYRRVRALYAPGRRAPRSYHPFVDAVAVRAMRADPAITEVRIRQRRWTVRPPPGPIREPGAWRLTRTRTRAALLPAAAP